MPKTNIFDYNPELPSHRHKLANNILNTLQKWGFTVDAEKTNESWEFVCSRVDKYNPDKTIYVWTSIDKVSGSIRKKWQDRIRVAVKKEHVPTAVGLHKIGHFEDHYWRRAGWINRCGTIYSITSRMCDTIKKAQKL
tara:strand:- start:88 stop:498 length:411 start_codon:yes stop_codon:yes gene_type:complete